MPDNANTTNLALFCDFENIALGVKEANHAKFDISKVLERLLLKGDIVVKKAYCDWGRYREFKKDMHEASFELIDIPHLRMTGKNSADIRMVVDALDLCYTKAHVDTFVIISGDSDFSPLVSKLRENNRTVIGVGVKNSTSELLIANCDEFILYDDLVNRKQRKQKRSGSSRKSSKKASVRQSNGKPDLEQEAIDLIVSTFEDLVEERNNDDKIWGSMIKQTLKRQKPGFRESHYGFRSFSHLLEEAARRDALVIEKDEKSGGYCVLDSPDA